MNREKILTNNCPELHTIDFQSPLQVGNGELAIGVDVTGLQTLNQEYTEHHAPLCVMSQWGWHSEPVSLNKSEFSMSELIQTDYDYHGRKVQYPIKKVKGNEEVYDWLRKNPHRANLAEISLVYKNEKIKSKQIDNIRQKLILESGQINSKFQIDTNLFNTQTVCDPDSDTLGFFVTSGAYASQIANVEIEFPYAGWQGSGMKNAPEYAKYQTIVVQQNENSIIFKCILDNTTYYTKICCENTKYLKINDHCWKLIFSEKENRVTIQFAQEQTSLIETNFYEIQENSMRYWKEFWRTTGFIDFTGSTHPKAMELQRRIILSQYLLAIQSAGSTPPQETGLLCNSWYGKFHLEMHLWHSAYMPLWNRATDLMRSMPWYFNIQQQARQNAEKNGYDGIRWPKMVGPNAVDSPSGIAPLLVWQQPHILYMLELIYKSTNDAKLLETYWPLYEATGDFMADFLVKNPDTGAFEMLAPVFPSQERFDPTTVKNPCFELEYWRFGFKLIKIWAERLGKPSCKWQKYYDRISKSRIYEGVYISHANAPETFTTKAIDHPSQLGIYGLIANDRVDMKAYEATLEAVLENWDFDTLWGWDYGMMSMAATRLGKPELALDILLSETSKNNYQQNGHNLQSFRNDLPAYLPGNGSLLLAIGLMVAGYPESEKMPGIPKNGEWQVQFENISEFPY